MELRYKSEPKFIDDYELNFAHMGDSGFDIRADIEKPLKLKKKNGSVIVPTGIYFEIPRGYELQVRSRSGLSAKNGIFVVNSPGTIDSSYTGEIKVILASVSKDDYIIEPNERIAQIVMQKIEVPILEKTNDILKKSTRLSDRFGSTGTV